MTTIVNLTNAQKYRKQVLIQQSYDRNFNLDRLLAMSKKIEAEDNLTVGEMLKMDMMQYFEGVTERAQEAIRKENEELGLFK